MILNYSVRIQSVLLILRKKYQTYQSQTNSRGYQSHPVLQYPLNLNK